MYNSRDDLVRIDGDMPNGYVLVWCDYCLDEDLGHAFADSEDTPIRFVICCECSRLVMNNDNPKPQYNSNYDNPL